MGEHTHISWCDHTFNPWIGCTKIAPACDGCYAAHLMDTRLGRVKWDGPPVRTSAGNWHQPVKWNKAATRPHPSIRPAGWRPPFVFCSSLADVFDNQADPAWRADLFELIRNTPYLVWLLLTKRPQNIVKMWLDAGGGFPRNAAIGTTIEDQKRADINVPHLLDAKAVLRPAFAFVSIEPLLGPITFRWAKWQPIKRDGPTDELDGLRRLDWVITGGETDQGAHKARPTHPQWFRDIRDQCAAAGTPYHHKQNGEWVNVEARQDLPGRPVMVERSDIALKVDGSNRCTLPDLSFADDFEATGTIMRRVGKKHSGRTIDGVTHDAFPELRALEDAQNG